MVADGSLASHLVRVYPVQYAGHVIDADRLVGESRSGGKRMSDLELPFRLPVSCVRIAGTRVGGLFG